jgi:hypothetical protein
MEWGHCNESPATVKPFGENLKREKSHRHDASPSGTGLHRTKFIAPKRWAGAKKDNTRD